MSCDLPAGWRRVRLGDVCQIVSGSTPKTGVPAYWGGDIPWLTPDDLSRHVGKHIDGGRRFLTQAGYDSCSTRLVPAGAVLYSSRAPIGYAAIATRPMCTNQGFKTAVPSPELLPDFLYWQLLTLTESIRSRASGTTFKEISGKAFAATEIVVPPWDEQERVVAVVEDHWSRLNAAEAYTAAAASRARSLLQASRDAATSRGRRVPLETLLAAPLRNGHSAPGTRDGGVRTLTLTAVTTGVFADRHTKLTSAEPTRVQDLWLRPADILVQRSNTPELVGTSAIYGEPERWAIFPDLLIRVRVDEERVRPAYAALALMSTPSRRRFRSLAKGLAGSMPKIDQAAIASTPINLPNLREQDEAIQEFERVAEAHRRLYASSSKAAAGGQRLRSQVLAGAVRGRL